MLWQKYLKMMYKWMNKMRCILPQESSHVLLKARVCHITDYAFIETHLR